MTTPPEFAPVRPPPIVPPVQVPPPPPERRGGTLRRILAIAGLTLLIGVLCMHLLGRLLMEMRTGGGRQSQQAINTLQQTTQQNNAQALEELERTGEIDAKAAAERSKTALQVAANQASGEERLFMQAMTELVDHWNQVQSPYLEQTEQARAAGMLDLSAVKDMSDVESRRAAVGKLRNLNTDLTARIRDSTTFVRASLQAKGMRPEKISSLLSSLAPGSPKIAPVLKIRDYETRLWNAIDECLVILQDHPKAWSFENGRTTFTDHALLERYNTTVKRIQEIGQAQVELQKSMLKGETTPAQPPKP